MKVDFLTKTLKRVGLINLGKPKPTQDWHTMATGRGQQPRRRGPLSLRDRMQNLSLKKENLDPRTWVRPEIVKGFTDFIRNKQTDKDTDRSFNNKEMCE